MNILAFLLFAATTAAIAQTAPTAIVSDWVDDTSLTHCGLVVDDESFTEGADLANLYPVDVDQVTTEVRCYFDFTIFPPGQHELTATFARCVDNAGFTTCAQGEESDPFVFNGLPAAPGQAPSGWGFE